MPIPPPPVPPIRVEFITPEPLWYAQWDFWVSVGTLILAAVTGWYAWETRRLRKGSDKAVAAAQQSADAAVRGVRLSEESMKHTLRAYVTVKHIEPKLQDPANKMPHQVNICVVNTGQTPARRLEMFYDFKILNAWPKLASVDIKKFSTMMQSDIGKDQERKFFAELNASITELATVTAQTHFLMAYGCVRYHDMFTEEPRHTYFSQAWDATRHFFYPVGDMNAIT